MVAESTSLWSCGTTHIVNYNNSNTVGELAGMEKEEMKLLQVVINKLTRVSNYF